MKILFSGHDLRFLQPFIRHCEQSAAYEVMIEEHKGHVPTDTSRCETLLPHADMIFCEWALGNAVWYSRHKQPHQTLVVRLHRQELTLPYLDQITWTNVDALILICPFNYNLILDRYPFLAGKARMIYNAINCDSLNQPKLPGAEFNLGIMGISPMLKAPHLAFQIFERLRKLDRRYTLYMKGKPPWEYEWLWRRPEERVYYETLYSQIKSSSHRNAVVFETYGDDVPIWFSKIGFILSTSDLEGSHQSVAEGMASGALPVIRDWAGAELVYPEKFVFSTVEEAVKLVVEMRQAGCYQGESDAVKCYAREHFHEAEIIRQYEALFSEVVQR